MKTKELVKISGQLNKAQEQIDAKLAKGEDELELDFSEATSVSVEGLEWLEELLLHAQSANSKVTFINVPPTIYKVFKVAHIDQFLQACGGPPVSGPVC